MTLKVVHVATRQQNGGLNRVTDGASSPYDNIKFPFIGINAYETLLSFCHRS